MRARENRKTLPARHGHFLLAVVSNFLKCVRSQADGAETNLPKRVQEKTSESF